MVRAHLLGHPPPPFVRFKDADLRAGHLGEHRREEADRSRPEDGDKIARYQSATLDEDPRICDRGGLYHRPCLVRDVRGQLVHVLLLDDNLVGQRSRRGEPQLAYVLAVVREPRLAWFAEAAPLDLLGGHLVPEPKAAHVGAQPDDVARELVTYYHGQPPEARVDTSVHVDIGAAYAHRPGHDDDVVGSWSPLLNLLHL